MPERWTRLVLRLRVWVLAAWLVVLVVGALAAVRLPDLLANSFAVPGSDSERARVVLEQAFGERPDGSFTVVFRVPRPSHEPTRTRIERRLEQAAQAVPTGRAGELRRGSGVLYGEVATALELHEAKRHTDALRRALRAQGGVPALVTGQPAIQHDLDPVFAQDLRRGEAIALPVALAVLVAMLGVSLAVAAPFVVAACTIAGTLGVVYLVAHAVPMVTYVTNLVALIGVGLAVDYSLLVVHRFREELAAGGDVGEAVVRTMATAGRAVAFSGLAVAAGLATLLLMPVPFIRSMGVGGLLIPLLSVAAAITLLPALLSLLGRRGVKPLAPREAPDVDRGFWARLARTIMRRPVLFLAAGSTVLLLLAVPALAVSLTPGSLSGVPTSPEALRGFELLRERVGPGAVTPITVVVDNGSPGAARRREARAAVTRLADALFTDPEVFLVAYGSRPPSVDESGRYARVIVVGRHEYGDEPTQELVRRLRGELVPAAAFPEGVSVVVGGAPAQGRDFLDRAYAAFPWLVAAVLGLTYLILLRAFRSLLLPLKAVLLNLLTVGAVCGVLVILFQWGVGADTLGLYERGQVEAWIPIFLFATLFGLSMDYEVFLVMRMRESWDDVPDNARAVAHGLERTGRIVTAAAVIMVAAFAGFAVGRIAPLQEFGVGLALAIALDVTIVRMVLVPSAMAVLGRYNWWLPARLERLFEPLQPR